MTLLGWLTDAARDHAPELLLTILLVAVALAAAGLIDSEPGDP
jgi:hypothetical protein